jgi:hypothetical protein
MQALLEAHLPGLGPQQRRWILDATAVAAYHADREFPVVRLLVCDDAPQCTLVTEELALCWVHEGRHDKKRLPYIPRHRALVEDFVPRFWTYYDQLLADRERPTSAEAVRLEGEFEALLATITGYAALDERIAKTGAKQGCRLMVLTHPEIPLHNNPAELGARARVRKRDVSFGPRTRAGATAWDTFMTLAETATKLGVSFYHYIHDRVSGLYQIPALADTIEERAKSLNLGASWNTSSMCPILLRRYLPMAHLPCTDVQARPTAFLDGTSVTLDELQRLVPPFEAAFQAPRRAWRLTGPPRPAHQCRVYQHCPLPTPAERRCFLRPPGGGRDVWSVCGSGKPSRGSTGAGPGGSRPCAPAARPPPPRPPPPLCPGRDGTAARPPPSPCGTARQ